MFVAGLALLTWPRLADAAKPKTDFNRDIRPILSDKCFQCHGPDSATREADLRLDVEEDAKADRGGYSAIVPGNVEESEIIRRIVSTDESERMPPSHISKELSAKEIATLKRWIEEDAPWSLPWTYVAPKRHPIPEVKLADWPLNWIDNFILARLEDEELQPSKEADRVTLIRRLSIDLCGLPPTPAEVDAFVNDKSPNAYERLVDRLLESPHYGERMAVYWLDLVRFADTVGYHGDQVHYIAPYRDYIINSLNANVPFDQFTREQLAGDLLDEPTDEQKIATGYNRVLQTTHEGGLQPKEYIAIYGADRVRNVSSVWLGGTVGCAQCHDHKFDPYSMKDFYSMKAFFADIDDTRHFKNGTNRNPTRRDPEIVIMTDAQKIKMSELSDRRSALIEERKDINAAIAAANKSNAKPSSDMAETDEADDEENTEDEDVASENEDGKNNETDRDDAAEDDSTDEDSESDQDNENADEALAANTASGAVAKNSAVSNAATSGDNRPSRSRNRSARRLSQIQRELAKVDREINELQLEARRSMITVALDEPRVTRVLAGGDWMDESGEIVEPAIPEFMGKLEVGDRRANRLDLANWFVDGEKGIGKLTARVMVNRYWYLLFGRGISAVLDDLGGQGEPPSHPELLDNLAMEYVESGWDTKHMIKLIVMSRAYRQSSQADAKIRELDPNNVLVSHQGCFRFPAEAVRDSTLKISGLLVDKVGGPSVNPYQPAGYYRHLNFPEREYEEHHDERQWRRGVYVHWQRQFLHPMLKAFDAPSREECTAQRPRSNTPLAALVLLNDPTFVEAARMFAARILTEAEGSTDARLDFAFREVVSRMPTDAERKALVKLLAQGKAEFASNAKAADELVSIGIKPVPQGIDRQELAAWTIVARTILSLSEALTRN